MLPGRGQPTGAMSVCPASSATDSSSFSSRIRSTTSPDRRIGRHPLRDLLQRLPCLHLHHRQREHGISASLPTTPPN